MEEKGISGSSMVAISSGISKTELRPKNFYIIA
jgi:hypothetical protein